MSTGYALAPFEYLGKQGVLLSFLVTQMFPTLLLLVPLYLLYVTFHNNINGLVIAFATTALSFSVWMLKIFFDSIPKELDQAGLVDGLNVWRAFIVSSRPSPSPASLSSFSTIS
jgi:arabinogalactan oligomer / maltooligosaccharide transport system permease protein